MATMGDVPEPSGPPEPVLDADPEGTAEGVGPALGGLFARLGELGLVLAVAGGAAFFVADAFTYRACHGATRSAQLEWQQREAEIEQAIAEADRLAIADGTEPARGVQ